jgi:hypothetical protein
MRARDVCRSVRGRWGAAPVPGPLCGLPRHLARPLVRSAAECSACCSLLPRQAPTDPGTRRSPVKATPSAFAAGAAPGPLPQRGSLDRGPRSRALPGREPAGVSRTEQEAWTRHPTIQSSREHVWTIDAGSWHRQLASEGAWADAHMIGMRSRLC